MKDFISRSEVKLFTRESIHSILYSLDDVRGEAVQRAPLREEATNERILLFIQPAFVG